MQVSIVDPLGHNAIQTAAQSADPAGVAHVHRDVSRLRHAHCLPPGAMGYFVREDHHRVDISYPGGQPGFGPVEHIKRHAHTFAPQ